MPTNFDLTKVTETEDGELINERIGFSVLTDPAEIPLKIWGEYFIKLEKQPDWFKAFHNAGTQEKREALQAEWDAEQWAKSYLIFARLSSVFVQGVEFDDLLDLPLNGDGSLLNIFLLVLENVYGYQPKPREKFTWKGRTFKAFTTQKVGGHDMPGANMSVRDAMQALQLEHSWGQAKESVEYNVNLGVLAALSREVIGGKVEVIPSTGPQLVEWQFDREALFEDITLDIALDVVFFSTRLKALSQNIPLSVLCLLRKAPENSAVTP